MKAFLILIVSLSFTINAIGQNLPDSGFTNKAEAKIDLLKDSIKEDGKWIMYLDSSGMFAGSDTSAPYYLLTVYKDGKRFGIERQYYKSGKLFDMTYYSKGKRNGIERCYYESGELIGEIPWTDNKLNGIMKWYYKNGKLKSEQTYTNDKAGITKTFDENGNEIK